MCIAKVSHCVVEYALVSAARLIYMALPLIFPAYELEFTKLSMSPCTPLLDRDTYAQPV
jgi:hypothetical protein